MTHKLNSGHKLLPPVIVVGLGEDVDNFFGPISYNLKFLVFLLSEFVAIAFPFHVDFLVEFLYVVHELLDDGSVLVLGVLEVNRRHVVVAAGSE